VRGQACEASGQADSASAVTKLCCGNQDTLPALKPCEQ
jgi:hypothetical protein